MNGQWLRLYTDLPHNLKLRRLSVADQLFYVWCLCLHKEGKFVGHSDEDIAWELRVEAREVRESIAAMTAAKLLLPDRTPTGWEERQFESDSSTERVRKHRAKRSRNVSVTNPPLASPPTDTETEADTETENTVATTRPKPVAAVAKISLDKDRWEWVGITDKDRELWVTAYPAVNLDRALTSMISWCKSNPTKAVKSNWSRFITNWLRREQDRGGEAHSNRVQSEFDLKAQSERIPLTKGYRE